MKLAEGEVSLGCYPAVAPPGRGAQITLSSHRLVWSESAQEEHYPLDKIIGVTYGYARASRHVSWAVMLLVIAIGIGASLAWTQENLPAFASSMVKTLSDSENPERIAAAQRVYEQRVNALMMLVLPFWGLVGALLLYALWLLYGGIRGETRLQIALFATTRTLSRRGRDPLLLEFGERLARAATGLAPGTDSATAEPAEASLDWIPSRLAGRRPTVPARKPTTP